MENFCYTCKHFYQHYGRSGKGRYYKLYCGHCSHPKIKHRKPDKEACEHYVERADAAGLAGKPWRLG